MIKNIKTMIFGVLTFCWCLTPLLGADVPVGMGDFTGSRTSSSGQIVATGGWDDDFKISWSITNIGGAHPWQYIYTITGEPNGDLSKGLSHIIIQVSDGLDSTAFQFKGGDMVSGPMTFTSGGSNPGLPGDIFGIKLDISGEGDQATFGFRSNRAPVWGDFYAKDGTDQMGTVDVYAYNAGFGTMPSNGDFGYWIPRPDTRVEIPEPTTMLLLGSSMVAAGLAKRRKKTRS